MNRLEANRELLKLVSTVVEMYPDWRFQQVLWNMSIVDGTDKFYEEPVDTLKRVREHLNLT